MNGIKIRGTGRSVPGKLVTNQDLERIARRIYNVFEDVLPRRYAEVFSIKSELLGMGAIKLSQEIDLVINLEPWDDKAMYDRFGLESHFTEIMSVKVPMVTIPVKPGRNLAAIVEVAAMNNRNRKMGHNAAQ